MAATRKRNGCVGRASSLAMALLVADQINRDNVAGLEAQWRASLRGSGIHPRSANQAQPLVYDGVIYVVTGEERCLCRRYRDRRRAL